jgi:hypothetical protein
MRFRLRTLLIVLALGPPAMGLWSAYERLKWSNCGGNNAALSDVRMYAIFLQNAADESAKGEFDIASATPKQLSQLAEIAHDPWLRGGQLLVSSKPYRLEPLEERRIIVVCDRPFRNVPRYVFGEAPPTHAAAYSDGSTALLSARAFAALDRSALMPLNEIVRKSN